MSQTPWERAAESLGQSIGARFMATPAMQRVLEKNREAIAQATRAIGPDPAQIARAMNLLGNIGLPKTSPDPAMTRAVDEFRASMAVLTKASGLAEISTTLSILPDDERQAMVESIQAVDVDEELHEALADEEVRPDEKLHPYPFTREQVAVYVTTIVMLEMLCLAIAHPLFWTVITTALDVTEVTRLVYRMIK